MTSNFLERDVDLAAVPWSRQGAYMALSMNSQTRDHPGRDHAIEQGLYLIDVSGYRLWRWNGVFRIVGLADDIEIRPEVESATPTFLRFRAGDGIIEVTWDGSDTIRFRSRDVGVRLVQAVLDPLDSALAFPISTSAWRLQMGEDAHYALTCIAGELSVNAPRVRTGSGDVEDRKVIDLRPTGAEWAEISLTQYQTGYRANPKIRPFDEARADTLKELTTWAAKFPPVPADLHATRDSAIALLWTNTVDARGNLTRPAVLMSKNWMHAVWSWDNCFVALGLADSHPELAWDQFMLFFDQQAPDGMLADIINDYGCMWGFCKPPVHGWTLRQLIQAGAVPPTGIREVYPRLSAWTNWWLMFRDDDGDGLAEYFHGCDSGQDNSAAFDDTGFPAVSPDLAAFLVVQMDVLAELASELGLVDESREWRKRADEQLNLLLGRLWIDGSFVVRRGGDGMVSLHNQSQVNFLPLVLGERLPDAVRSALALSIPSIITPHGIASESPQSPRHEVDGYWRGPIWAPTTYLVIDGLRAIGESNLAESVRSGYLKTVQSGGFAENYEATTGSPLRDRGYSWSAAVFLRLAGEATAAPGDSSA
jgi:putative isomerase